MSAQAWSSAPVTLLALVTSASAAACAGNIDDAGTAAGQDLPGGQGGRGGGSGVTVPSPDTGIWRLTRTEYNNTVRDLLGDTTLPANALDPDDTFNGFDRNADVLTLAEVSIDRYDAVANDVVERAFRVGSASRKKLLGACDPVAATCARSVVAAFVRRAWRRPVTEEEIADLMTALDDARAQGDGIEDGVRLALRTALVSPHFLYRTESDPPGTRGLHPVSPHELATRLAYFVWSSTPDDRLLDLADAGTLGRPEVFAAELARALDDSRADSLVGNFATQWLDTRRLGSVSPDAKAFPSFNDDARKAMIGETQSFFRAFFQGDRNVADMLETDFTFANDRLAKYYGAPAGFPNVTGSQMQQVTVDGAANHRFGLLSQAGMLTLTSRANRTSPVNRGRWVLSRLLCSPPPLPPPDAPPLASDAKAAGLPANATIRQMMEAHRKTPVCAACHAEMDAIGFGLEHYNGVGIWRPSYPGSSIDATGRYGGQAFDGAQDLARLIKDDPRFTACLARTMFAYALGRDPTARGDQEAIERLTGDLAGHGGRLRALVDLIASSQAFRFRGGRP